MNPSPICGGLPRAYITIARTSLAAASARPERRMVCPDLPMLAKPSGILRDATLRVAPQDEEICVWQKDFNLSLRSRRRRRLEGRTAPGPRRPMRGLNGLTAQQER